MAAVEPLPPTAFTIWHRDAQGKPLYQYRPEQGIATHVVASINICRGMLTDQRVRAAFKDIAAQYSELRYPVVRGESSDRDRDLEEATDMFIKKICATFPLVFIDYSLQNPDSMGAHAPREWDKDFEPRNQSIVINGPRASHMWAAAVSAAKNNDEEKNRQYRAFLFRTANMFLHELGHMFTTYLTQAKEKTPPPLNAQVTLGATRGEAGRLLEKLIFGGTMSWWRDPDMETPLHLCGVAYLHDGTAIYRLLPETIDNTVEYKFEFPYRHDSSPELRTLKSMAPDNTAPHHNFTDPLLRDEVAHLRGRWFG